MPHAINPFYSLYLTEGVGEFDFPALFSPVLVPFVTPLFQPSNVVLRGMQGTGKSMLLSLLDSKIRLEFWQNDRAGKLSKIPMGDPLQPAQRRFIGASINLSNSKALMLRDLVITDSDRDNDQLTRAYFADFMNCAILRDLLGSIRLLITRLNEHDDQERFNDIGLCRDPERFEAAAQRLAEHPACEFLAGQSSVIDMQAALEARLRHYRRRINSHRYELPESFDRTRSPLGEPLEVAAEILRDEKVIERETQVFVTIDQFETLSRWKDSGISDEARRSKLFHFAIEELLSSRSQHVFYRIGTRPNAQLVNCDATRDYAEIDLDSLFQRREHDLGKPVFHRFLEDAFQRRLATSRIPSCMPFVDAEAPLQVAFGSSDTLIEQGEKVAPKNRAQVVSLPTDCPPPVAEFLIELAQQEPVEARLGEAWLRQQLGRKRRKASQLDTPSEADIDAALDVESWRENGVPWLAAEKRWWRKERLAVAVLQLAASNAQRWPHYGEEDIVLLSGENVLAFLCICREIWECDARHHALDKKPYSPSFPFDNERQAEGILDASNHWHRKISSSPAGDSLMRFMDALGKRLHEKLAGDRQMSYPGANGISLTVRDYEADPDIKRLLDDATAECYLLRRRHTPKNLSRGESIKWYPHPILAPYYELTLSHTKEPLYLSLDKLRSLLEARNVVRPADSKGDGAMPPNATPKSASRAAKVDQRQKLLFGLESLTDEET